MNTSKIFQIASESRVLVFLGMESRRKQHFDLKTLQVQMCLTVSRPSKTQGRATYAVSQISVVVFDSSHALRRLRDVPPQFEIALVLMKTVNVVACHPSVS